jgi:TolB-like protein
MPQKSNKLSRFWQELKRRRIIHVITVYASATFVIIELVGNLAEPLNLPPNLPTIVIILLAVGFPLAIVLSWLYDLTAEGVEKTKPISEVKEGEKPAVPDAWKIATYVSFVVIIGLVTINIVAGTRGLRHGDIESLAILPFDNFTGDDQLDWVASGMHSSLIGDMGKVSGLRVLGKTTSNAYKETNMTAADIAKKHNVDALVEPTLTCYGDMVCIQVRVITPYPEEKLLWVEDYMEDKSQILNLYNRITRKIVNELKVNLSQQEESLLAESRIVDPAAYDAFLAGRYLLDQISPQSLPAAIDSFKKAIALEPEWAAPYAGIAEVGAYMRQAQIASESEQGPCIRS